MSTKKFTGDESPSDVSKEQLIADFNVVMSDAEALIKATANQGGEALAAVRARAEASLAAAREKMTYAQDELLVRTKEAAKVTDVYVHENPWQSIGLAAGIGVMIGIFMGRR